MERIIRRITGCLRQRGRAFTLQAGSHLVKKAQ